MADANDVLSVVPDLSRYVLLGRLRFIDSINQIRRFNSPKACGRTSAQRTQPPLLILFEIG